MASDRYGEIVRAATTLFSKKGYEATSVRDIADAVHLKPGSLYAHIRSKEDLLAAIIERVTEEFYDRARPALAADGRTPSERLRAFLAAHLTTIAENLPSATVFLHEWEGLDAERLAANRKKRVEYERLLVDLINEGVRAGEFRAVEPRLTAKAVLSVVNWAYTWYSPAGPLAVEEIADYFFDLLVSGLGAGPRAQTAPQPRRSRANGAEGEALKRVRRAVGRTRA